MLKALKWILVVFVAAVLAIGAYIFVKGRAVFQDVKATMMSTAQGGKPSSTELKTEVGKKLAGTVDAFQVQIQKSKQYQPFFRDPAKLMTISSEQLAEFESHPASFEEADAITAGPFALRVEKVWPNPEGQRIQMAVRSPLIPGIEASGTSAVSARVRVIGHDGQDLTAPSPPYQTAGDSLMFVQGYRDQPYLPALFHGVLKAGADVKDVGKLEGTLHLRVPKDSTEICVANVPGETAMKDTLAVEVLPKKDKNAIPSSTTAPDQKEVRHEVRLHLTGEISQLLAVKGTRSGAFTLPHDRYGVESAIDGPPVIAPTFREMPDKICLYVAREMIDKDYSFSFTKFQVPAK